MTAFSELLKELHVRGPLRSEGLSIPLGAAWLASDSHGIDIVAAGYVEEEYLISGAADVWTWDSDLRAVTLGLEPYTTRIVLRRPEDPGKFSGVVQLEPNHPDDDRALTWGALAPWILRSGHAHVGVTQDPGAICDLQKWDPERYGGLSIPDPTQRWDILGQVAALIHFGLDEALKDLSVKRIIGSGWSMTGTFWRTFLGEGFHERCRLADFNAIDGYVICISSGGAGRAGYGKLREDITLPPDDSRRTIGKHGIPIIELLSEAESETHHCVLREDEDGPEDYYRLYEVAGTSHIATGAPGILTNRRQFTDRGWPPVPREIVEARSTARMDFVARAVFEALDHWIEDGLVPPHAGRFSYLTKESPAIRGIMEESLPLARDSDGNVLGGIRTPWVDIPTATYVPHSSPSPGRCLPAAHAPYTDPKMLADLIGHMVPFTREQLAQRYPSREAYLLRFYKRAKELAEEHWLLDEEAAELCSTERNRVEIW